MEKVGGAIERIDNPEIVAFTTAAGLFAQEAVIGIGLGDDLDNRHLGLLVHLGDKVILCLAGDGEGIDSIH